MGGQGYCLYASQSMSSMIPICSSTGTTVGKTLMLSPNSVAIRSEASCSALLCCTLMAAVSLKYRRYESPNQRSRALMKSGFCFASLRMTTLLTR